MSDQSTPAAEETIDVVDPNGTLGTLAKSQLAGAVSQGGFRLATPADLKAFEDAKTYGTPSQEALTGVEAAGSAATFGLSRELENASGLTTPEAQAKRAELNQTARRIGTGVGLVGPLAGTAIKGVANGGAALVDLLNPVEGLTKGAKAISGAIVPPAAEGAGLAARMGNATIRGALTGGIEGAGYGAGSAIEDHALGDPDALGDKFLAHVGTGVLWGGGLGGVTSFAGEGIGSGYKAVRSRFAKAAEAAGPAAVKDELAAQAEAVDGAPEPIAGIPPQSFEQIQGVLKNDSYQGMIPGELPARHALVDASQFVPDLEHPVLAPQIESLNSRQARDTIKAFEESGLPEAKDWNAYQAGQKHELTFKLGKEIDGLSAGAELTSDPVRGGDSLVDAFTTQYQTEKNALKPIFQRFDEKGAIPVAHIAAIPDSIEAAIPGTGRYIKQTEAGLELMPYRSTMPFSRNVYESIKDVIEAANDKELTIGGVRNVRGTIGDKINWLTAPREAMQLSSLKKSLMNYMEAAVNELSPDVEMRGAFKSYAINEENRGIIERIFGGSISDKASFAKQIKSEEVLDKLFANTVAIKAAKAILPPEVFNKAMGDYLRYQMAKVTDAAKNGFSSNKFATFLRTKGPELEAALADSPQALARMRAMTDIMRILPDSPSINPSGTAKTLHLLDVISKVGKLLHPVDLAKEGTGAAMTHFAEKAEKRSLRNRMAEMLKGKTAEEAEQAVQNRLHKYSIGKFLKDSKDAMEQATLKGAKAVFSIGKDVAPGMGTLLPNREENRKKTDKHTAMIENLATNPDHYAQVMDKAMGDIAEHIPAAAAGISGAATRALQYLHAQLPPRAEPFPIPTKAPPSRMALENFHRALDVVEQPLHIFGHIKAGTLTPEHMQALSSVYPSLYGDMKAALIGELSTHLTKAELLPYATKLSMSLFMGQPLDSTMTPQSIQASQTMIQAQPQNNQGSATKKTNLAGLSKLTAMYQTPQQSRAADRSA